MGDSKIFEDYVQNCMHIPGEARIERSLGDTVLFIAMMGASVFSVLEMLMEILDEKSRNQEITIALIFSIIIFVLWLLYDEIISKTKIEQTKNQEYMSERYNCCDKALTQNDIHFNGEEEIYRLLCILKDRTGYDIDKIERSKLKNGKVISLVIAVLSLILGFGIDLSLDRKTQMLCFAVVLSVVLEWSVFMYNSIRKDRMKYWSRIDFLEDLQKVMLEHLMTSYRNKPENEDSQLH